MKIFLLIMLTLITSGNSNLGAKKSFIPYEVIMGYADLIVEGEISKVNENSYEFKIFNNLKSKINTGNKIIVNNFQEWTCDKRIVSSKVGQKLLLFLTITENKTYEIINGSTGELFIEDVEREFSYDFKFNNYLDIKRGIQMFGNSYKFTGKNKNRRFIQLVCDIRIKELENKSMFFKSLSNKVKMKYQIEK